MIDRLSGDYIRGYTAALLDMQTRIPGVIDELKRAHRRLDVKNFNAAMALIVEHRAEIRDSRRGFVRWNYSRKELEWYVPEEV